MTLGCDNGFEVCEKLVEEERRQPHTPLPPPPQRMKGLGKVSEKYNDQTQSFSLVV